MNKTAFITGITGQDGSYLMEHLLNLGYDVWGLVRRSSNAVPTNELVRISGDRVNLRYGDMTDAASLQRVLKECNPDEVYNLAAQSHVRVSFDVPEYTSEVNATGVVNLIEAVRNNAPNARVYQASTSEMFGSTPPPQNEDTGMHPRSPYGVAKLHAYWSMINARESYDMFTCNGILFNHESERRGENFVTRKITKAAARISLGKQDKLFLGNIDAKRDWGYAKDYVKAMHLFLQHDTPDDYVVATGKAHTVRYFLEQAFLSAGMEIKSNGKSGVMEVYYDVKTGSPVVEIDTRFYRPAEVDYLCGDATKALEKVGWKPETSLSQLVEIMVKNDLSIEGHK